MISMALCHHVEDEHPDAQSDLAETSKQSAITRCRAAETSVYIYMSSNCVSLKLVVIDYV